MTATPNTTPAPDLRKLAWKSEWGHQVATDSRCYYIRESGGSIISATIFSAAIVATSGWLGVTQVIAHTTISETVFGVFMLFIAAVFIYIPWVCFRSGRWMVVYDRGEPGIPGEIRYQGKRLSAEKVRSFSTRGCGGNPPKSTVVAELHDGTYISLGPVGSSTWPAHYAQHAAQWMGLPYRHSAV